jgi:uncharacterized phage protein (TIGR02220 family)
MTMAIIKIKKSVNYTVIDNTPIKDVNLSLQAKGLIIFLMSLPNDFEINKTSLHQFSKNGRDSTIKAFDELMEAGYITQEKKEGSKFGFNYTVSDIPSLEIRNGIPVTENKELINKEKVSKVNNKKANKKDFLESYKELVEYFQKTTGKQIRLQPTDGLIKRSNKYKLVANRLIEGATLEDLKRVIDLKTKEWKGDKKMVQYLRFETLFNRSKFESYLDEVGNLAPQGDYSPPYEIPDFKTEDERYRFFLFRFTKYKPHLNQTLVNTKYRQRAIIEKDAEGLCYDLEREFPELLKINISFKGNN